jgi:hypothetical protein
MFVHVVMLGENGWFRVAVSEDISVPSGWVTVESEDVSPSIPVETPPENETYIACAFEGCTRARYEPAPGTRGRRSKFCAEHRTSNRGKSSDQIDDDPFSAPLTSAEKRLVKNLALPIRLLGAGVYRANMIDGMIVGDNADKIAEAWVLEGRVSKSVRQMSEAVAKFAGAGPLAMVAIDVGLEIAANHNVPVIGTIKPVPLSIVEKAEKIKANREIREVQSRVTTSPVASVSQLVTCPSCLRRALRQSGPATVCMCGVSIAN